MRVIAGKMKSRLLKSVDSPFTRPTTDKNKENLFNMIGPYFDGGTCLDLFGGSGGLGIEAISRGMDYLYSVDKQYKAYAVIKENFQSLGMNDCAYAYKMDYQKALKLFVEKEIRFDLVFLDPPYGLKINESILHFLSDHHMLNKDSIIVVEDLKEEALSIQEPYHLLKQQEYGKTVLQILKYEG